MSGGLPDVVVPTTGRPGLGVLLEALKGYAGRVLVVDDRAGAGRHSSIDPRAGSIDERCSGPRVVLRSGGRGPAAARNVGWRAATSSWVCFLDDDVVPEPGWAKALEDDLAALGPLAVASQGRVRVPLPEARRPTDWERNVAGLERARWATADLAVRRAALEAVGGFDERFPRAYREDADLGLRLVARGLSIARGTRIVAHPVGPASRWVSVAKQRGNADDALMDALHGRDWRERAGAPRGRFARHAAVSAAGAVALGALARAAAAPRPPHRRRVSGLLTAPAGRKTRNPPGGADLRVAAGAGGLWLAGTAEFAWARIAPGPRTRDEVATMVLTSAVLPPAATVHRVRGVLRARRLLAAAGAGRQGGSRAGAGSPAAPGAPVPAPPLAVLLDRDDTLIHDVPYNGDPALVLAKTGVTRGLERLREAGIALGIVSNQSGLARGILTPAQVQAVMDRTVELLGPFGDVRWCPHGPGDGCSCRKPAPGMLLDAAAALGVDPLRCAMVGDIGADVEAARAAGMRGILVPTDRTLPAEIKAAAEVAPTFRAAVELLLAGAAPSTAPPARLAATPTALPAPTPSAARGLAA